MATRHPKRPLPEAARGDALGRRVPRVVSRFIETEAAGGVVLLVAGIVALAWANSPWHAAYETLWSTHLAIQIGSFDLDHDLGHWVNDGLMVLFFFVVGLEIKRELVHGDLRDPRTAMVPVVAALGGMVVPALLYVAFNAGGPGSGGWGIPMATDIAFAVGVLALLGPRVPASLKLFLLTLAIVDDIGAILVIALFYSSDVDGTALLIAAGLLLGMIVLGRMNVQWLPFYVVLGFGVWLATHESGIHATIAGVVLGLLAPARRMAPSTVAREWARDLGDEPTPGELRQMTRLATASVSTAERLEHALHPWTSFLVVPVFALANAGVRISGDSFDAPGAVAVTAGIMVGLVAGKTFGIAFATWLAVRSGVGRLPEGARWSQLFGVGAVAGIGFTVSLFVADLAFADDAALLDAAKVGVLAASAMAAAVGLVILGRRRAAP